MDVYGMVLSAVMLGGLVPVVVFSLRHARKLEKDRKAGTES
jgi:hypothetical protein